MNNLTIPNIIIASTFIFLVILGLIVGSVYLITGETEISEPSTHQCATDTVIQSDGSCASQEVN